MNKSKPSIKGGDQLTNTPHVSQHRSGAVARMLRMPVATLRVWERRYGLTQPELSPSGQRLYSAQDVRRLALIKQLTDLGHAIGSLAALDMLKLQQVAATHAQTLASTQTGTQALNQTLRQRGTRQPAARPVPVHAWRLAVVGAALHTRLQRPALLRQLGRPLLLLGPFDSSAQAAVALHKSGVDALLINQPHLHPGWLASFEADAPGLADLPKAVLYGYAADAVCESMAAAGTALLREPQPDAVLVQWLRSLALAAPASPPTKSRPALQAEPVPPRRWDDAALADFAGLSSTVACECPRHVAELLMQLSRFEAYSAECEHRSAADAELHAYLRQVTADSRARFEAALEHVALHEGLILPPASPPSSASSAP